MNEAAKPELKQANDNPWYCLATLYGEWDDDLGLNTDTAERNRKAWNLWYGAQLTPDLVNKHMQNGISNHEMSTSPQNELTQLIRDFKTRIGSKDLSMPDPKSMPDFTATQFDRSVQFAGYIFPYGANFDSTTFSGHALFKSTSFTANALFKSAVFKKSASFELARFSGDASFELVAFSNETCFDSAIFRGFALFKLATFQGNAKFESTTLFSGDATFESATFTANAFFKSAVFEKSAFFELATFSGDANFDSTKFYGFTSFTDAIFSNESHFTSVTFSGDAMFESATFTGHTNFESATFWNNAIFGKATFSDKVIYRNSTFLSLTSFDTASFNLNVPDFRGAKLHEATEWHRAQWPPPPKNIQNAKEQVYDQVYAYERLKQEMERLKKHEDEQAFFRRELRARRELYSLWSMERFFDFLYEFLSNYGHSTKKPLLWLLASLILWSFVFLVPDITGMCMTILEAVSLSFANLFLIFPIHNVITPTLVFSSTAKIIVVVESFSGTLLLFLLGVALRNQFRMR